MKILALSDIHENTRLLKSLRKKLEEQGFKPEVTVIAGDITKFKGVETARKVLLQVKEYANTLILFVPGNCDSPELLRVEALADDIFNIHSRAYELGEYVFYGIGGGGMSPFYTPIEFSEEDFERFISKALQYAGKKLILITHQPILGFFDEVNGARIGSQVFAEYLNKVKPLIWITGHVHENRGWTKTGSTYIVHPGPFMRGYFAILEVRERDDVVVELESLTS